MLRRPMPLSARAKLALAALSLGPVILGWSSSGFAQAAGTTGKRSVVVGGIVAEARVEDVLAIGHNRFQGLIAVELSSAGFAVEDGATKPGSSALTLWGSVKEESCDGLPPGQCRVAVQWELQDRRGVVVYRTTTRAVTEGKNLEQERRELVLASLRSLLQRRRFGLQLAELDATSAPSASSVLGFKECHRELHLPAGLRAAASAIVLVVSGSTLARGTVVSADGLVLTTAEGLTAGAPLTVRFAAGQSVSAEVAALDRKANLALLRTLAPTDNACIAVASAWPAVGAPVYGVSSALTDDAATSLTQSTLLAEQGPDARWAQLDARIAGAPGAPLLDEHGKLVGLLAAQPEAGHADGKVWALRSGEALAALRIKPAAITDARLAGSAAATEGGYVRDADDPPFVLGKRYTYGTAPLSRTLRTVGLVTAGGGVAAVAYTWLSYRSASHPTPAEHDRFVLENDVGWILLGLGAAGVGVSFALPESHEVVAVGTETAARRHWSIALGPGGIAVGGSL